MTLKTPAALYTVTYTSPRVQVERERERERGREGERVTVHSSNQRPLTIIYLQRERGRRRENVQESARVNKSEIKSEIIREKKMVAALRRKKWRLFSAGMVSTVRDSTKRHCLPPLCGKEAVKFRWGSVACSGRSGRGECGLFRWYCCAFVVLNIGMGVLARQV